MSVDAPPAPITLDQSQADQILAYSIENKMYQADDLNSVEAATRIEDAKVLVFQAKRAYDNKNTQEPVVKILSIAYPGGVPASPVSSEAPVAPASPAPAPPAAPASSEADPLAQYSVEQLQQARTALQASPQMPSVVAELQRIEATIAQRGASVQAPSAAPVPAAPVVPAVPVPVAPQAIAPIPVTPDAPPVHADGFPPVPGRPNAGVAAPAAPLPADSVPLATDVPAAPVPATLDSKQELLKQLTFDMLTAYGLTTEAAFNLSEEQICQVLANPSNLQQPTTPAPDVQPEPLADPERDALISQVTGPMLKAWKHGRRDIADMDNDKLRLMIANPDGDPGVQAQQPPAPVATSPTPPVPAVEETPSSPAPVADAAPEKSGVLPDAPPAPVVAISPPATPTLPPAPKDTGILELIEREGFPIPPEIEEPYRLPNDVSKVSDDGLKSLHARAHATEARCNWIISERDDEKSDLERLIADQIRIARENLPETEEGKKLTKVRAEELIDADPQLVAYREELKKHERGTSKIKLIRDNAHRDCERMSRQWSMRFRESEGSWGK